MSKYLVTGGAGFIGSHLCEALLEAGHEVVVLDDLSTGSRQNIAPLERLPRLRFVVGSIRNTPLLVRLVDEVDGIFHLAAAVGVRLCLQSVVRAIETNVLGTAALLDIASEKRRPLLLVSSSEVYGRSTRVPFAEDDDLVLGRPTVGRWAYGCSKALDEYLALAHARERGLPVRIARLFNIAGPRQKGESGMVLPRFVRQALAGEPITVHGDGLQRRCFCYVSDVVGGLIRLLAHPEIGAVVNLGGDESIAIAALAERVRVLAGSTSPIIYVPYAEAWDDQFEDTPVRLPDLGRARRLIGFSPTTTLDEIIERVIDHARRDGAVAAPAH